MKKQKKSKQKLIVNQMGLGAMLFFIVIGLALTGVILFIVYFPP